MTARRRRARVRVQESPLGRELRVDDTFASWYRPGSATTGSVWDALAAPILALPQARRRRVLILGLGGGSAARLMRALAPKARIVGVEFDADVLRAARRHFDLDALALEVVHDDARAFLARERRRFDLVCEDVFVGTGSRVRKPDWLPEPGLALAARRILPGGLLVTNALDEAPRALRILGNLRPGRLQIEVAEYDNRILVAGPADLSAKDLRRAVAASDLLAPVLPRLRFRTLSGRAPASSERVS